MVKVPPVTTELINWCLNVRIIGEVMIIGIITWPVVRGLGGNMNRSYLVREAKQRLELYFFS